LTKFTPFSDTRHNGVNNSEYCPPNEISKHHCCEAPSLDHSMIELSPLTTAEYSPENNCCTRCVTGNEDDYYPDCRTPPSQRQKSHTIDQDVFKTTSITSTGYNQPPDTGEVTTAPLNASIHGGNLESSVSNWRTRRVTDIEDDDHEYRT